MEKVLEIQNLEQDRFKLERNRENIETEIAILNNKKNSLISRINLNDVELNKQYRLLKDMMVEGI